jgi:ferredoxin
MTLRNDTGLFLVSINGKDVKTKDFDSILDTIRAAPENKPLELVFVDPRDVFKGPAFIDVKTPDGKVVKVKSLKGQRLLNCMRDNKIEVYPNANRFTNCGGAGQCGTCAVLVTNNEDWDERPEFEALRLKKYPASARLSCNTVIEGDCTVTIQPPKA